MTVNSCLNTIIWESKHNLNKHMGKNNDINRWENEKPFEKFHRKKRDKKFKDSKGKPWKNFDRRRNDRNQEY